MACDERIPVDDAAHVVAYVEHKDHRVHVLWVRDRRDASCFKSLREAVHEIAVVCDHGSAHAEGLTRGEVAVQDTSHGDRRP